MPHASAPRILGFDVPSLKATVDTVVDAPVSALLEGQPDEAWIGALAAEVARAGAALQGARLSVEGGRILFFASADNARELCNQVRELVDRVNHRPAAVTRPAWITAARNDAADATRRVLVVEDDPVLREVVCDLLEGSRWSAVPAADAAEAVALLEAEPSLCAVFTDIHMPGAMNGEGLVRIVRERWPALGVVATSGHHVSPTLGLPDGVVLLQKPYQARQLVTLLERACAAP